MCIIYLILTIASLLFALIFLLICCRPLGSPLLIAKHCKKIDPGTSFISEENDMDEKELEEFEDLFESFFGCSHCKNPNKDYGCYNPSCLRRKRYKDNVTESYVKNKERKQTI